MIYIGIDPGQSGGIAVIRPEGVYCKPMPETPIDILTTLKTYLPTYYQDRMVDVVACIEQVHAMPGNGVASMFKFGMGYGTLKMALFALGIQFSEVSPQAWQKGLAISPRKKTETPSQWKNRLREKAQQLFPVVKSTEFITTSITKFTADALLIAEYCRRVNK